MPTSEIVDTKDPLSLMDQGKIDPLTAMAVENIDEGDIRKKNSCLQPQGIHLHDPDLALRKRSLYGFPELKHEFLDGKFH